MSDREEKRYDNEYRLSETTLKRWTRALIALLIAGVGGCVVVMLVAGIMYGNGPVDEIPSWVFPTMSWLAGLGIVIPLIGASILGGLAIHRFGWIPLLVLVLGMIVASFSNLFGVGYLAIYGFIAIGLGVIGIFVIAVKFTKVPIWLQLPMLFSPRLYLRKAKKKKETKQ